MVLALVTTGVSANETATTGSSASSNKLTIDITPSISTSTIGGRIFIADDSAVVVNGRLSTQAEDKDSGQLSGTILGINGAIMKYFSRNTLSPFWQAGGGITIYSGDAYKNRDAELTGLAGIGAEYAFNKNLSIRSVVGASLQLTPAFALSTFSNAVTLSYHLD